MRHALTRYITAWSAEIRSLDSDVRLKVIVKPVQENVSTRSVVRDQQRLGIGLSSGCGEQAPRSKASLPLHARPGVDAPQRSRRTSPIRRFAISCTGSEPRGIEINEILKVVSRRLGVSQSDLLFRAAPPAAWWSGRARSACTRRAADARSLREVGHRFGAADESTKMYTIRKNEAHLARDPRLKDELENWQKMLGDSAKSTAQSALLITLAV